MKESSLKETQKKEQKRTEVMKDRVFQLCDIVRETGYAIHRYLGPGHLEKIYEQALFNRLTRAGRIVERQKPLQVFDEDGSLLGEFNADLLIEGILMIELKAVSHIVDEHLAQILGYLRASAIEHGLLVNFGSTKFSVKKFVMTKGYSPQVDENY